MLAGPALIACCLGAATFSDGGGSEVRVSDVDGLRRALGAAGPGTVIRLEPGTYRGGISVRGVKGASGRPVVLTAADPQKPPVFEGGAFALHFSSPEHLELRDLVVAGATDNGINIDDGGSAETPARDVVLRGIVVRDVGPRGNRDGIKLSGLEGFRVEGCTIERWGDGGSGIDMVGCGRGEVAGCTFRHGDRQGGNAVQVKGGSRDIAIRRCRFEHAGQRAVNIGGSTGLAYFRPRAEGFEAKSITVEDCTIVGSLMAVAFVGVDGATVRNNTIYRPMRWGLGILQENAGKGFVPCRNGRFIANVVVYRSDEMMMPVNVGPGTAAETFEFAGNAWYCLDAPGRSRPRLPVEETDGVYGVEPKFRDAERGDYRFAAGGAPARAGARDEEAVKP